MVKFVLFVLVMMSIISWAIILYKIRHLRKVEKETHSFYELFWKNRDFSQISAGPKNYSFTPLCRIFKGVYSELVQGAEKGLKGAPPHTSYIDAPYLSRLTKKTSTMEMTALERGIPFLATTGNTAPFIGLFGTVWGIMNSFRAIGIKGSASLAVVAPGISEALVATAMGLFAAIPAVMGYNHILTRIDRISGEMDNFSADLLNIVLKQLKKNPGEGSAED